MGTEKRERQKANRLQRQLEAAREERNSAIKRNVLRWSLVAVLAVAGIVLIAWVGGAFDDDDEQLQSTDEALSADDLTTATDPVATVAPAETTPLETLPTPATLPAEIVQADPSECPATDGSEAQRQEFDEYPPFCIDVEKTYTADVTTNFGEMSFQLDPSRAPLTVNSFVTLAHYHYFDGTECHRAIPGFVVQCGDPTATGTGGPGYRFSDELPEAGEYKIGSLAMANSGPNTNGSQFFIITGDSGAALPPQYSLFGEVVGGLDTTVSDLDAVANPADNGVPPLEQIIIESVVVTENA
ncbi:MAG: peptidylprolyl isomerase [Ilumatobacter sp.]|uniref:peptidylprolyl isomerase n=1 Tax=Ilumatobacter sp. TaxID=1967498 RepID=UPI0026120242|nr:peptidylprolyl isomerase [Ilumatobacter sp.]MDJ0769433.1 peptidylprolyl isomerase [Ilumatobacter sp.]